ncbi:MAG: hypothetical protein IJY21_02165 [Clostridia bacterium]|nr:hypothetical protein [Clostridia bacterium]
MKNFKKLLVSTIALMMAFSMVACGGGGGGSTSSSAGGGQSSSSSEVSSESSEVSSESSEASSESSSSSGGGSEYIPQNPYTLNVYSFTGGYGEDWLNALTTRYKKERAGDVIEVDGKTYDGITFNLTKEKGTLEGMVGTGDQYDVWFQEQVLYNQYVGANQNVFKDMTDVLTSENPYEEGKTLESKMTAEQKAYYMRDGKYYGIPHYAGYVGIVYNKKLFDANSAYFAKDYEKEWLKTDIESCFIPLGELDAPRTPGPDGVEGTDDDGLPTTYEEFYALCEILSYTCKPIAWSGAHRHGYLGWFLTALSANNDGLAQASLNYSFEGTADNLISVTEDEAGNVTITDLDDLTLDAYNNGYKLASQRGKYYALDFLETIVDNGWYATNSFSITNEQTDAQRDFVEGTVNAQERAAMLVEGCWWEMEAKSSFSTLEQGGVQNAKDNFGWFPLPCIDDADAAVRAAALSDDDPTTKGYTLTDTHNSLCFIGAQVSDDVYAIAKDFIQFAYTDESLAEFSIITDTTKAVQYTMTPAQKAQMSAYGRSLMEMQENANIVYSFSKNDFFKNNESMLVDYKGTYSALLDGKQVDIAVDEFRKGVSATKYFNGLQSLWEYKWNTYMV